MDVPGLEIETAHAALTGSSIRAPSSSPPWPKATCRSATPWPSCARCSGAKVTGYRKLFDGRNGTSSMSAQELLMVTAEIRSHHSLGKVGALAISPTRIRPSLSPACWERWPWPTGDEAVRQPDAGAQLARRPGPRLASGGLGLRLGSARRAAGSRSRSRRRPRHGWRGDAAAHLLDDAPWQMRIPDRRRCRAAAWW